MKAGPSHVPTVLQLCATLGFGGSERLALESADAWQKAGGHSIIAGSAGGLVEEIIARNIEFYPLPTKGYHPWSVLANIFRLIRLIRNEKVDIIHFHNRMPGWSALVAARLTHTPTVSSYHSAYGMQSKFKRGFNSVMVRADKVIATSQYIVRYMEEHHGADIAHRRVLIRNGIDLENFDLGKVSPKRITTLRTFLSIKQSEVRLFIVPARLTRLKGHAVIIDAVAQLISKGITNFLCLFVGGDAKQGAYRSELEQQIERLYLGKYIRFTGPIHDMPTAYALADFAILASTMSENIGLTRMEASAMGLPLITTNIGGAAEVVLAPPNVSADKRTGWLVPAQDPNELAKAMEEALNLPVSERTALAQRARQKICEEFDAQAGLQRLVGLYRELARYV